MILNKKVLMLCIVIVVFLITFFLSKYFHNADSNNTRLNEGDILKIAQLELGKREISNEKYDYSYDLKKGYDNNWNVKVRAISKDPRFVVRGGGCQMRIDGIIGEVLSFYTLP